MKERPILFSGPMVRAILDGRKTQTRRVVKPQPKQARGFPTMAGDVSFSVGDAEYISNHQVPKEFIATCPYGRTGDRLWVRETFRWLDGYEENPSSIMYQADQGFMELPEDLYVEDHPEFSRLIEWTAFHGDAWKPSIHMPRWASRITLEIESVRVERLNDISEEDARAEGIGRCDGAWESYSRHLNRCVAATTSFRTLWEIINGRGSWHKNPWVWVVTFKRIT